MKVKTKALKTKLYLVSLAMLLLLTIALSLVSALSPTQTIFAATPWIAGEDAITGIPWIDGKDEDAVAGIPWIDREDEDAVAGNPWVEGENKA